MKHTDSEILACAEGQEAGAEIIPQDVYDKLGIEPIDAALRLDTLVAEGLLVYELGNGHHTAGWFLTPLGEKKIKEKR